MRRITWGLLAGMWLSACGDANLNEKLLVTDAQKRSVDQLLLEARYKYDKGEIAKALALADQAAAINPYNEDTLILKSYIYLSRAGLDGFSITKNLISQTEKKADTTTTTTTTTDKTSDAFSVLAGTMKLSSEDMDALGTPTTVSGTTIKVYYPLPAAEARAGGSATLDAINSAITTLCPLISDTAKSSDDSRHICPDSPNPIQGNAKSHFAWALAHLGEAIAFNKVVLFDDEEDAATSPNIQDVATSINKDDITQLVARVTVLQAAVAAIFPTGDDANKSMLNAMFNDLAVTNLGFGQIPGIPSSVTKTVSDAIESLKAKVSKIGGAASSASKQNEALRNSLTTGLSTELKKKIEASSTLSAENKVKACCAYRAINTQATDPSNCSTVADTECL